MYTKEQRERMHDLFRQKLASERITAPTKDTAYVNAADLETAFPELRPEEAAELAITECQTHWQDCREHPRPKAGSGAGRFLELSFTDERGHRRNHDLDLR